jgi:hypothetical protein
LARANAQPGTALSQDELAGRFQVAGCSVHGYAMLWVEGSRKSRSFDEARCMLRTLKPSLVTREMQFAAEQDKLAQKRVSQ